MLSHFAGLDVSDKATSICVMHTTGRVVLETVVETTPAAILSALGPYRRKIQSAGLEGGTKATWVYKELVRRKLRVICLDARHTHAALSVKRRKTDKSDARGIAQLLCRGIFTVAHIKSDEALRLHCLLMARKMLQRKALEIDGALRSMVKLLGGEATRKNLQMKVTIAKPYRSDLVLDKTCRALQASSAAVMSEVARLEDAIKSISKRDRVCRRLMTIPGVGPLTAIAYRAAIDDPTRFKVSRDVAAYFGLVPRRYQSGQTDLSGHITKIGDPTVRGLLCSAASALLYVSKSKCVLRAWALEVAQRKGAKIAMVACARKLAMIMHRMWVTETDFKPNGTGSSRTKVH
jgi:transposase